MYIIMYFEFCVDYIMFTTRKLIVVHPLTCEPNHPFCLPPNSFLYGNHQSNLHCYVFVVVFIFYLWVRSYGIWLSPSDLFHIVLEVVTIAIEQEKYIKGIYIGMAIKMVFIAEDIITYVKNPVEYTKMLLELISWLWQGFCLC